MSASDSSVSPAALENAPELISIGQEEFAFLSDFIPQLVWITDPQGSHTYFNQRWVDYTGYTVPMSVGPDMWNNLLHPDDQQRARQVWGHSLSTGDYYRIEYRFKSKTGTYRWFLGQALPRRNENGQIVAWFGTCTDIEEQRQMREQLELAYSDLEAKVMFRTLDLEREVQTLRQRLGSK